MLSYQDTVAEKDKIGAVHMYSGFQHESGATASAGHALEVPILVSLHPTQPTQSESRVGSCHFYINTYLKCENQL